MIKLENVTLLGLDCVDLERLKIARDICTKDIEFGAVKLLSSIESDDKDVIKIDKVGSIKAYSEFMIKKLNDYVDTEFVLVFQYDGFVLDAKNWREEFLNYDYIGSPWIGYSPDSWPRVGNGGFSLRSKRLLEILAHDDEIKLPVPMIAEDGFICYESEKYLKSKGIKFAPVEVAGKFGIADVMKVEYEKEPGITERQYREYLSSFGVVLDSKEKEIEWQFPKAFEDGDLYWTNQFGFHYLTKGHLSKWLEQNPEYKGLIKIKE